MACARPLWAHRACQQSTSSEGEIRIVTDSTIRRIASTGPVCVYRIHRLMSARFFCAARHPTLTTWAWITAQHQPRRKLPKPCHISFLYRPALRASARLQEAKSRFFRYKAMKKGLQLEIFKGSILVETTEPLVCLSGYRLCFTTALSPEV